MMRISKFLLIFFFFLFYNNYSFSKPRCDLFYDDLMNREAAYPDDEDVFVYEFYNMGIDLLSKWDVKNDEWTYPKSRDGNYFVGKVLKESLVTLDENQFNKIMIGDEVISINNKEIDEIAKNIDFDYFYLSKNFKENEKISIKLSRNLSNGEKKVFEIEEVNKLTNRDEPYTEIYINYIDVNEKEGTIDVTLQGLFSEELAFNYNVTKFAHKNLVQSIDENENYFGKYPTEKDIEEGNYNLYECPFSEEQWTKTNTKVPYYYLRWDNLIAEDKTKLKANYFVYPSFLETDKEKNAKYSIVEFKTSTSLKIKNDFDLRSFPFDRQALKIKLYSVMPIDNFQITPSAYTFQRIEEFKSQGSINGWNIKDIFIKYGIEKKPENDFHNDALVIELLLDRKSGYYVFKIIIPIILILMICWSATWINPREIESRLTITIVCLLSLIAYNFVIDSELPKLEYLTIMDLIILISYVYAAIPNFLSIYSFKLIKQNKLLAEKYEVYGKKYGLPSYLLIIIFIILVNVTGASDSTNPILAWATMK